MSSSRKYSASTIFRQELIEPSDAREVFSFGLWSRGRGGGVRKGRENGANLVRLETSDLKKKLLILNIASRQLYKLQAKFSSEAVAYVASN